MEERKKETGDRVQVVGLGAWVPRRMGWHHPRRGQAWCGAIGVKCETHIKPREDVRRAGVQCRQKAGIPSTEAFFKPPDGSAHGEVGEAKRGLSPSPAGRQVRPTLPTKV